MTQRLSSRLLLLSLGVALAAVVARATMLEGLRDPFGVTPNSKPYPRGAGPASALVLDLICCLPALGVLLARTIDKQQIFKPSWACRIAGVLGLWAAASTFWADDKFAAVVGACGLIAAFALLWAAAQLVNNWQRFRLVTAIAHGLLLVYLTQAVLYRFVELPETLNGYRQHKAEFLRERGWQANDFLARQFEKKLVNGELLGFNGSANSLAATLVLLMGVSAGLCIQRLTERSFGAAACVGAVIPITFWILFYTQSKAAFVTPLLIALILGIVWRGRSILNYFAAAGAVIAAVGVVIGYGLMFHSLPTASLNFRWRYWTAAWRMFLAHPMGVGWNNFGLHYLHYRLAVAAEEIQDPHNFFLRFLTELGVVGAILSCAWLARLWWEMTTAASGGTEQVPRAGRRESGIGLITLIAVIGMTMNVVGSVDFGTGGAFVFVELIKRALFVCVLVLGACVAAVRLGSEATLDNRPAPWALYALLASLAAFLVHNLIEFALFESGPLMIFALLAGSALGIRQHTARATSRWSGAWLAAGAAVWVAAAIGLVVPMISAEALAARGDEALRTGNLQEATDDYLQAYQEHVPFNADYIYRAALAMAYDRAEDRAHVRSLLDQAIAQNPSVVVYYLSRARLDAELHDTAAARTDFNKALELNPNEVSIRMDYGDALMNLGQTAEALDSYQSAFTYNDLLPAEEPKRLNDGYIRAHLAAALSVLGRDTEAADECRRALGDNDALPADDPRRLSLAEVRQIQGLLAKTGQ